MKTRRIITTSFIFFLLLSCGGDNEGDSTGVYANEDELFEPDVHDGEIVEIDRKLIKTSHLDFEVDNIHQTEDDLRKSARELGGYIANERQNQFEGSLSYTMEIKVPSLKFDMLMKTITEGVDEFDSKSVDVKDVSEEFVDIEARLKTKKEVEQRYIRLLEMAYSIEEIIEIEEKLKSIREEIEVIEGRLKLIERSVAFSTIHATFYQVVPVENHFGERFGKSLRDGWFGFVYFLIVMTNMWPFILITIVLIVFYKWKKKKSQSLKS